MEDLIVRLVETEAERKAAFDLRIRVFVGEQGVPREEELDDYDDAATHAVALMGNRVVGTGRMLTPDTSSHEALGGAARIGRMAVDAEWRRRGIGGRILTALEDVASQSGLDRAVLHAQTYVKSFYAGHGYVEEGDVFLEVGIEHVQMGKRLAPPSP